MSPGFLFKSCCLWRVFLLIPRSGVSGVSFCWNQCEPDSSPANPLQICSYLRNKFVRILPKHTGFERILRSTFWLFGCSSSTYFLNLLKSAVTSSKPSSGQMNYCCILIKVLAMFSYLKLMLSQRQLRNVFTHPTSTKYLPWDGFQYYGEHEELKRLLVLNIF